MEQEKEWRVNIFYENNEVTYEDNKYEIIEQIGKGASANVFKAKKILKSCPEEFVALRIQRRYYKDDFDQLEALKNCHFKNTTCPIQNYAGRAGLFTEQELFDNNVTNLPIEFINENTILLLVETIGQALEDMHDKGYIHCDVKPDNIVYKTIENQKKQNTESEIQLKFALCDFSSILEIKNMKESKFIQMTPIYAAPEINLQGKTELSNEKQDIWSLGVTIYNLFQNNLLFSEDNLQERKNAQFIEESLSKIQSKKIQTIIEKCLILEPERRASIKDILSIIKNLSLNDNSSQSSLIKKNQQICEEVTQQEFSPHVQLQQICQPNKKNQNVEKYQIQKDLAPLMSIDEMLQLAQDRYKINEANQIQANHQLAPFLDISICL